MPLRRSKKLLHCSFCRKDSKTVAKLIGGPGVYICDACVELCNQILDDQPVPPFPGFEAMSDDALLATLRPADEAVSKVAEVLHEHVATLRERGVSWQRIGEAIGVSRQAVWERFSDSASG